MVEPFPWGALPRVDRRAAHAAAAGRAWLGSAAVDEAAVLRGRDLDARLADPTAGVVRVRAGAIAGFVVVPGLAARAIAQRVLGGPAELGAARPLTVAERAILVAAVAERMPRFAVEPSTLGGPEVPRAIGGEAAVIGAGGLALVLPVAAVLAPPRAPLDALAGGPLGGVAVAVPVAIARAAVPRARFAGLRGRDVLVAPRLARGQVELVVGRGALRGGLAPSDSRVTVLTHYVRGPMDDALADDATVDVAVTIGELRLSVRSLLELAPGQVLDLGKPLGSAVELRVGPRVVARGELVDVGGDVGVRVLAISPVVP